jgi:3-dehydroquinate synthetase
MTNDKKATSQHVRFILPTEYATVMEYDFTPEKIKEFIESYT